jgi:hypothetical protein
MAFLVSEVIYGTTIFHIGSLVVLWSIELHCFVFTCRFFMQEPPGDILVFLTGQDDIEAAVKLLNEEIQHLGRHYLGNFFSLHHRKWRTKIG